LKDILNFDEKTAEPPKTPSAKTSVSKRNDEELTKDFVMIMGLFVFRISLHLIPTKKRR